jgi:hypothetical protein
MKNGIFYVHLEYITAIWYILWTFGHLVAVWYIFPRFGILYEEKSGNPERPSSQKRNRAGFGVGGGPGLTFSGSGWA